MNTVAVDFVIKASVVVAIAALTDRCLRRRASAATRHFVWTLAVGALLALPMTPMALPAWSVRIPIAPAQSLGSTNQIPMPVASSPRAPDTETAATVVPTSGLASHRRPFDPFAFAFALYSAGVVLLLSRLVGGQFALRRLVARADIICDGDSFAVLNAGVQRFGIRRVVRLLQADDEVMPFTFGTRRPTIVLPAAASRWSADRRQAVMLHELAHVARADCLAQRLAAVACALYWPHPGVWWAARRLRVEREFACDDRVLSLGTGAREYATHLLDVAHAFRARPAPATALGMARARQLEHRLLAVIDDERNRRPLARTARFAAAAVASMLLLPIATLRADLVARNAVPVTPDEGAAIAAAAPAGQDRDKSRDRFTSDDFSGTWELRPSKEPGMVQVNLRTTHSQHGTTVPLSRLEALTGPGMTAAVRDGRIVDGTVHFTNRRDAGTFTFDGTCRNQMCGGTYSYAPDPAFPARLAKYGIGTPTASEQYELAMEDVGISYVEGVKAEGYAVPDVHTLVRAAEHGVSLDYLKAMAALGYRLATLDPLIRMRDHGVDPTYVKGMAAQGFAKFDGDELVRMRDHGVDPEYVKGMRDLGYDSMGVADLVKMRDHGVDPEFARGVASLGYKNVPLDALVRMRDHGVDSGYVRGLADAGYKNLPIDVLVRMRDHGVDPDYARGLATLGYKDVNPDSLIRLRDHGVDLDYVRRIQQRGGDRLSVEDLIRRRDRGDDGR
jgi:beta-lactamase regulating signal transducer with metallopeptidase domain